MADQAGSPSSHGAATSSASATAKMSEAQRAIEDFWPKVAQEIQHTKYVEPGNQLLPLARIKKIMKLDEDVKMISAEAPLLFAKAAEMFIHELTLRAWLHTEDNKRRTLQRSDIAMAIAKYDQFDFLIDIVPRDEIKPARRDFGARTSADDVQYYFQLAQQHQQALQGSSGSSTGSPAGSSSGSTATVGNVVQLQTSPAAIGQSITVQQQPVQVQQQQTPQIATITTPGPSIILTNPTTSAATLQTATNAAQAINPVQLTQGQPLQLVQQVMTPSGEITHIPIPLTQNQLSFIRSQMQLGGTAAAPAPTDQQPIIIQAPQIQAAPSIIQATPTGLFLNTAHLQQQLQQQHVQQVQQQPQQQQQVQSIQIIQRSPQQQQQHHQAMPHN